VAGFPPPPAHALGAGDCEAWRPGPLGQPTNAVTSLAYLLAAGWLWRRADRVHPAQRWRPRLAAAVSAATGVGSVAFHGVGGRGSHVLHDGSMLLLLAWSPIGARRWPAPGDAVGLRHRREVAALATVVGLVSYALGRTDAPTCRPTSRWQWHGLWHVAGAVATAAWSDAVDVLPHLADDGHGLTGARR
jgi:hypothetical protein